uniref:Uncharacterized protein n=1 Tax=Anguilla anguilla TaxID=7936 RepID=A0A0E9WWX8_ANGAN
MLVVKRYFKALKVTDNAIKRSNQEVLGNQQNYCSTVHLRMKSYLVRLLSFDPNGSTSNFSTL